MPAGAAVAGEWQPLFVGHSLDGWAQTGPGHFEFDTKEKCLTSRGGMGMLWYYYKSFDDFSLQFEWKVTDKNANSGVFVRFPNPPAPDTPDKNGENMKGPWAAVREGHEIQICDTSDPKHRTGSVYTFAPSSEVPTKPVGEWNKMVVTVVGPNYTIEVNGKKVSEYKSDRSLKGYIGLQNHAPRDVVSFRNIAVKELD
jgi:hypothetical protein